MTPKMIWIINYLRSQNTMIWHTAKEIADKWAEHKGLEKGSVYMELRLLCAFGKLVKKEKMYRLADFHLNVTL